MSKINTTYWGANVNPATIDGYTMSYGASSNNIRNLIANNSYDPNTESFDYSVSPWGIGYSAAGNRGQIVILRNGSRDGSAPGTITKIMFDGHDKENTNRPFALIDKNHYFRDSFRWLQSRVGGDITVDGSNYMKNAAVAYGSEYLSQNSTTNGCLSLARVATYLDYQKYKLRVRGFIYINLDTGIMAGFDFIKATETPEDAKTRFENFSFPEHMAIVGIKVDMVGYAAETGMPTGWDSSPNVGSSGNAIQLRGHSIGTCINFNQITPTAEDEEKFKLCFTWSLGVYNNSYDFDSYGISPYNYWSNPPYVQNIPVEGENYRTGVQPTYNRVQVNGLGFSFDDQYRNTNIAGNFCDKEQNFADIKYKQRPLLYKIENSIMSEVKEGTALTQNTQQFRITSIYEVVDSDTFTKAQILALIKHEVAFYGFQFYISWGNAYGGTWSVGDDDLYLPKFDEHLITTGLYTSGTAALAEENATWGNVFADDMPDYDVDYNPAPPEPGHEEKDFGDLTNRIAYRQATQGTIKYVAGYATINQLQNFLNGSYLPDNPAFIADFKGTNPQDYIISVQKYPFALPHHSTAPIVIGSVDTNLSAGLLYGSGMGILPINSDCTFDFGEISVARYFGDFRDYLSKITLMMPFIGSIDLDPKLYIDHTIGLQYLIDFDTGAVAAEIKRDGLTMETKTSTISITIPFFSANMGAYQNALAQTGFAIEQSKIKQIAGIMSTALSVGAGLASGGTMSDTAALGTAGGLIGGATSMISGQMQQQQLQYELEHTAPQIGTISVAAPANAFFLDDRARLLITRPAMIPGYDAAVYSHTVGNACAIPGTLSSFSGYTIASAAELSSITARDGSGVSPTAEELRMIKQALQAGVYV